MITILLLTLLWNLLRAFLGLVFLTPIWITSGLCSALSKSWPAFFVLALTLPLLAPPTAHAAWFSWPWANTDTQQIERSAELAQEAARVAAQAAEAQSHQAAAQADQNSRVAEVLGQLSSERQTLAEQMAALARLSIQDSQVAAVLESSGPVLVCVVGLLVAALALWGTAKQSINDPADLARAMDVLVEAAVVRSAGVPGLHGRTLASRQPGQPPQPALIGQLSRESGDQESSTGPMPF